MLAHEQDICALLERFAHEVAAGLPPSYATYKRVWTAMRFSYIFEVRAESRWQHKVCDTSGMAAK